jgi:sulfate permease, SulP family
VIGLAFLLLDLMRRIAAPRVLVLGRVPHTTHYTTLTSHPEAAPVPGLLICQVEGALLFANALNVQAAILQRVAAAKPPPMAVVVDLAATPALDFTAVEMLDELTGQLAERGICLELVALTDSEWDALVRRGLSARHDNLSSHHTLQEAVDWLARHPAPTAGRPAVLGLE